MQSTLLDCKSTITGDILNTGTVCGNSAGVILNIGFKAGTYGFLPLIQSCYNMKTASVIYTRHIIYGKTIDCKYPRLTTLSIVIQNRLNVHIPIPIH